MKKEEIEIGNKLIAEFMGWTIEVGMENEANPFYNSPYKEGFIPQMILLSLMRYNLSWDWLMPVVEKIEKISGSTVLIKPIGCEILVFGKTISKNTADTKIEAVWLAVVEFIKWYNLNNKTM